MKKVLVVILAMLIVILASCSGANKPLWKGEWVEGTITVRGSSQYNTFMVEFEYGSLIAKRTATDIEGDGVYALNIPNSLAVFAIQILADGDNLTLNRKMYAIMSDGQPCVVKDSNMKIIAIYGID